jgi:UDP-N-acetylmuramoyl-L-alanyl-D-glutamate--2,6-diaminopimelate ligase
MQVIRDDERLFVVDYAHTPDALIQVLKTLKRHVSNQLWAVFDVVVTVTVVSVHS